VKTLTGFIDMNVAVDQTGHEDAVTGVDHPRNVQACKQGDQGSMLWSQFSAIFSNFRQKIGVFLKNQCYDQNFCNNLALLWVKNANFSQFFFGENIFKIITSVPDDF
jgi:hypothetical protein